MSNSKDDDTEGRLITFYIVRVGRTHNPEVVE